MKQAVSIQKIGKINECLMFIKQNGISGSILEFGVYEGGSLFEIVNFCRLNKMTHYIYGFDSFQGLPHSEGIWSAGEACSSYENTCSELKNKLGTIEDIVLIKGFFKDSLTKELQKIISKAALIHIDSDLYMSAVESLSFCEPLLRENTFVIFDEYVADGEAKAWKEFLSKTGYEAETFSSCNDQSIFKIKKLGTDNKKKLIELYKKESLEAFNSISTEKIIQFVDMIFEAYDKEKTIFVCGNGGNVASALNLVVDLNMHPFTSEDKNVQNVQRNKFKCVNLCCDQATLTGVSNDLGFEFVFSEQLKYQGDSGDILFGMSGSGNSKNILSAFKLAKQKEMKIILVTRNAINKCSEFADLTIALDGMSLFPGQTGNNNNNFHYEDILSKLTHIAVGLLKKRVQDAN